MIPAVMPTYARSELMFDRGEGPYLYATNGRRYLDFSSGVAVTSLGHAHPRLVAALTEQAQKLWHCSNLYQIAGQKRLAERLVALSFADTAFFCNSGAEAMEGAIKVARKYHAVAGHEERYRLIACTGSFHGRTLATLAAAGAEKYLKGFGPPAPGFDHVAYGNLNEMRAKVSKETAGIIVEPVQGEGGLAVASIDYLKDLRTLCDEFGLLLIFDEVQTGMGRTGKLFAHEWAGVTPDIMALAKGLGGGFPIGAVLATETAAKGMTAGTHGSTFGGNPLAMAVANEVLTVMTEPGFLPRVERIAHALRSRLEALAKAYPKVFAEVRGKGLLVGFKCVVPNLEVVEKLRGAGLLTVAAGENVVRLLPPLIIDESHVEEAVGMIKAVAGSWS
ncbi:MAG: aspartate aminotransferase family protein [Alphaproteobacteria bacterium]|nr:aspartate aminotransferase family protein [Alphaproteobacteria bacterium]